jgi:hypothetical protein
METNLQKSTWMKKKYLAYGIIPAFALALAGAGVASAHGFGFGMSNLTPQQIAQNQTDRFTKQAALLGVSVDEVKTAWAKGQTLQELANSKGITAEQLKAKMQAQMQEQQKAHLQALVDQGVITQDQMNQRLQFQQANPKGFGRHGRGMGMMGF